MPTPVRKAIAIYGCAIAIAGATPFVLLPVLTKNLEPRQFGEVTSFLVLTALLGNIAGLSSHGYASVRFFKSAIQEFRSIVSSSIAAILGAHALALALVAILFPLVSGVLRLSIGYTLLAVGAALLLNMNLVFLAIFQSSGRPWLYLRSRLVQGLVEIATCLGLIFLVSANAGARIYSYTFALGAASAVGLWACMTRGYVGVRPDKAHVRNLLSFGVPMLPHILAGTAISYLDRLVVSSLMGQEGLGVYMVAMQVGMAMIALIEPFNKALAPWLFGQLAKGSGEVNRLIVKRTYLVYCLLALAGIVVAMGANFFFPHFVDARFSGARPLIPWMIAGFVMQGMYYTQVNYLFYAERTGTLSIVTGTVAATGCLNSYLLTSHFGLRGAGVSFLLNNALLFLLVWFAASRIVPMPWRLRG